MSDWTGSKLPDLTPAVVGDLDDDTLLYIVSDPAGSPADKSLALSVLQERLSATFVGAAKIDAGGAIQPAPLRVPTLTVDQFWPRQGEPLDVVWTMPDRTLYAVGRDNVVYKCLPTAGWIRRGAVSTSVELGYTGAFLRLTHPTHDGVLLAVSRETPPKIYRSTAASDGASWSEVFTFPAGHSPIGPTCWAEDPNTGYIYLAPYKGTNPQVDEEVKIYRSTDGGQTFAEFFTFPGQASSAPAAEKVRHVHGVQWDPVDERITFCLGDADLGAGIYRVTADGDDVEKVVTNNDIGNDPETNFPRATSINVAFLPNSIVWISDQPEAGIYHLPRAAFGSASSSDVSLLYRPNSTGWFAIRAASDNSQWILSASNEVPVSGDPPLDRAVHLYAVEEDDAGRVFAWEVGADKSEASSWAAIAAVGAPHLHGDQFWLRRYAYSVQQIGVWRCRLARGGGAILPLPAPMPPVLAWETRSSGNLDIPAGGTVVFGRVKCPSVTAPTPLRAFRYFNLGVEKISGSGTVRVEIYREDAAAEVFNTTQLDYRSGTAGASPYVGTVTVSPGETIAFRITETGGEHDAVARAFVTYGFGEVAAGLLPAAL